jgi:hypothetical protein
MINDQQIFIFLHGETRSRSSGTPFAVEMRMEPGAFRLPVLQGSYTTPRDRCDLEMRKEKLKSEDADLGS